MICEEVIESYLKTLKDGFHCRQSLNGRLSLLTPYLYPDHDNIEVAVRVKDDEAIVSDLGETLRGLDTLGLDVINTPNALFSARRIADGFGVFLDRGILSKRGPTANIGSLVFDVVLACQSVGSLVYGNRAYEPAIFEDEVTNYLSGFGLHAERKVKEKGITGKKYLVSLRVPTLNFSYWISTISPKSSTGIQRRVNYNFRMWSDLSMQKDRKINLLNDDLIEFKQEDIRILETVSTIHRWTKRQDFVAELQGNPPVPSESGN